MNCGLEFGDVISGTFLVTADDDTAPTLRDVHEGQVFTVESPDDLDADEVLEATLEPVPPLSVVYTIADIESRRTIPVELTDLEPTALERDLAAGHDAGEIIRYERAGTGEIHVITAPDEGTKGTAANVVEDRGTIVRAAKLGVDRVEVRAADGVVSVRYLPP